MRSKCRLQYINHTTCSNLLFFPVRKPAEELELSSRNQIWPAATSSISRWLSHSTILRPTTAGTLGWPRQWVLRPLFGATKEQCAFGSSEGTRWRIFASGTSSKKTNRILLQEAPYIVSMIIYRMFTGISRQFFGVFCLCQFVANLCPSRPLTNPKSWYFCGFQLHQSWDQQIKTRCILEWPYFYQYMSHMLHVWNIYQHLGDFWGTCC